MPIHSGWLTRAARTQDLHTHTHTHRHTHILSHTHTHSHKRTHTRATPHYYPLTDVGMEAGRVPTSLLLLERACQATTSVPTEDVSKVYNETLSSYAQTTEIFEEILEEEEEDEEEQVAQAEGLTC